MKIYNSLSRRTETFKPEHDPVSMFVCGPTVYDFIHAGNARTFVIFDMVAKYLRYAGWQVKYVQNITDIDNRIIHIAHESGRSAGEVADEFKKEFLLDIQALHINSVNEYASASAYIDEIIIQIKTLIEKKSAYAVSSVKTDGKDAINNPDNQDVYFDMDAYERKFSGEYGRLSGQAARDLHEGVRVELENNKKNPRDFVLWKAQNYTYEPSWQSPWGMGRPGWHIEDTAISEKFFGPQYDLHGGGQDLKFPHHEAEIAQQQAASGKVPFVKYWMHSGFIELKTEKMSKSLGNIVNVRDLIKKYGPYVLRLYFLSAHYRAPLDFSETTLKQAQAGFERIQEFIDRLSFFEEQGPFAHAADSSVGQAFDALHAKTIGAMDDDLNTPQAIACLFESITLGNQYLDQGKIDMHSVKKILTTLDLFDNVLGIIPRRHTKIPEKVRQLVQERQEAKEKNNFAQSDFIRAQIQALGYTIDDTPHGPMVKKVK